jgi:parallel beta-helix repeat protein
MATLNNSYFSGVYAATGQTPKLSLRVLDYTPSDSNTIYVASSLADTSSDGTSAHPVATIAAARALCDASHQNILINDSETYTEVGWEFTGNVINLRAAVGCTPVVKLSDWQIDSISKGDTGEFDGMLNAKCCSMADGKIVFFYKDASTNIGYIRVYENEISGSGTQIQVVTAVGENIHGIIELDGDLLLFYNNLSNYGCYKIVTVSGVDVKSETTLTSSDALYGDIALLSNGNVIFSYSLGKDIKYTVLDADDWSVVKAETTIDTDSDSCLGCGVSVLGDKILFSWERWSTDVGYFIILNDDFTTYKNSTQITAVCNLPSCLYLKTGQLLFVYTAALGSGGTAGYYPGKLIVLDEDGNTVVSETTILDHAALRFNPISSNAYGILSGYTERTTEGGDENVTGYFQIIINGSILSADVATIINGITFECDDEALFTKYFSSTAESNISNCTFDLIDYGIDCDGFFISTTGETNIDHCSFRNYVGGLNITNDSSVIKYNEFYKLSGGYAAHIVGAAGTGQTIQVTHNTFFNNYAGLQLEDNDGNELVKNNIFHDNNVYGILAETGITISYTLYTDTMSGVTNGSSVILANPLFVNEGALVADDTDLKIKLRVLGYPADSPAYQLADDTSPDRDAGAWDIIAIGSATTWTNFTVEKPATGIKVTHEPINALINKHKDGSLQTSYDGWAEVVEIDFVGIKNADYANFMLMLNCDESQIRFYPDPTTNASSFNLYNLIYDAVNSYTKMYKLTRTGIQDFTVKFARSYEP